MEQLEQLKNEAPESMVFEVEAEGHILENSSQTPPPSPI